MSDLFNVPYGAGMIFVDKDGIVRGKFVAGFKKERFHVELLKILNKKEIVVETD